MANDADLAKLMEKLMEGPAAWNDWRAQGQLRRLDLSGANLAHAYLAQAILCGANLHGADLRGADLRSADLGWVDLDKANLSGANLSGANLSSAILIETNLTDADLTGCRVYGISAWNLKLDGAKQRDLVITRHEEPEITVDNLEVAQFIYLLLNNEKIRSIIDTIGKKGVLLLGRFTQGRLTVLERLREELPSGALSRWCSTSTSRRPRTSPRRFGYSLASPAL